MFPSFVFGIISIVASRRRRKNEDGKGTRPVVSREEVAGILKKYYGIEHSKIRDLDSYDDLNFRVETEEEFYVLKVFSSRRGDASMVIMENKAMEHIESNSKNVAIPRVISPRLSHRNGVVTFFSRANPETPYYVRLLTYLPGTLFGHMKEPASEDLLERLGRALGDMDRALSNFDCASAHRKWEWDLTNCFEEGKKYCEYIEDVENREIAKRALSEYANVVIPLYDKLRWRVIHSDANDYNICVDKNGRVGIFDFGDMVYSPLVHNVSIAIAYACLKQKDFMAAAKSVLRGYRSVLDLSDLEMNVLFPCIKARLAHSVCKSAYSRYLEPDNEYISVTEGDAWRLLRALSSSKSNNLCTSI